MISGYPLQLSAALTGDSPVSDTHVNNQPGVHGTDVRFVLEFPDLSHLVPI